MADAVHRYQSFYLGNHGWILGRFILPVSRLSEFEFVLRDRLDSKEWRLSCVIGEDVNSALNEVRRFNDRNSVHNLLIDAVEINLSGQDSLGQSLSLIPAGLNCYYEVSPDISIELLEKMKACGGRAKIRTGGVKAEAIPQTECIAGFLKRSAEVGICFKATAGLHHPLQSIHPLTYEPDAPVGRMHGFLGVFLAAAFARQGMATEELVHVINSDGANDFSFGIAEVQWHNARVATEMIRQVRQQFAISFGSCSVEEPTADLQELQLL